MQKARGIVEKIVDREAQARMKLKEAREKARATGRAAAKNAVERLRASVADLAAKKAEAKAALRDAKAGLGSAAKEVRAVTRDAKLEERKAEAREKAVAAFIRRWDNAFDKKVAAKNKSLDVADVRQRIRTTDQESQSTQAPLTERHPDERSGCLFLLRGWISSQCVLMYDPMNGHRQYLSC